MSNREYVKYQGIKFFWHPFYKDYLASKCGKILSLKRNKKRILKGKNGKSNYLIFCLYENNKKKFYLVHRFIFETFKGEIPNLINKQITLTTIKKIIQYPIFNFYLLKKILEKSCCKKVISLNIENKEEKIFDSLTQAAEYHQISK